MSAKDAIRKALFELAPSACERDLDRYASALAIAAALRQAEPQFRGTEHALDQLSHVRAQIGKLERALDGLRDDELVAMRAIEVEGVADPLTRLDLLATTLLEARAIMEATEGRLKSGHQHGKRKGTKPQNRTALRVGDKLWRYASDLGHDPSRGTSFERALSAVFRATGIEASGKHVAQELRRTRRAA